ncbi:MULTISPECIES: YaaC family protein [unclassified Bradyrhizobium]
MQDWNDIRFLESTTNLKTIIKKSTGKTPSTEVARDIAACLQQGRLFFEIASSAPLQVQPLQIYYGMVGFAKAIVLARNIQSISTIAQSHGLSGVAQPTSKVEDLTLKFHQKGLFAQFNDVVASLGRPNYFDNSMPRSEPKPFDSAAALGGTTCSFKDILGRIPSLQRLYQRTFSEDAACWSISFYHRGNDVELRIDDPHLIADRNDLRLVIDKWRQKFPFLRQWCLCEAGHACDNTVLLSHNVDKPSNGEFSDKFLIETESGFSAAPYPSQVRIPFSSILPALAGGITNDHPTAIQPLNGVNLSEFALQFCGAFLLSSLVRYRPQVWQHALSHSAFERRAADDRALSIIEAFSAKVLSDFSKLVEKSIDWANSRNLYG